MESTNFVELEQGRRKLLKAGWAFAHPAHLFPAENQQAKLWGQGWHLAPQIVDTARPPKLFYLPPHCVLKWSFMRTFPGNQDLSLK